MDYSYFGNTGLKISRLALGTQTFGWNIMANQSNELMQIYFDKGGNYFDTADSYNEGRSEQILGDWLKDKGIRDDVIIGTKTFFETGNGPNDKGSSRKHIIKSVETSLKRLHTDYIDLLQIHCFDAKTPIHDVMMTLDNLVKSGKVRYVGVSNFVPSKICEMQMIAKYENLTPLSSLQLEYSLLVRSGEWELIPVCQELNVGMLGWSPLSGGWLTGKYQRGKEDPKDSRVGRGDRIDDSKEERGKAQAYDIIDELLKISHEIGRPVSQISLNWIKSKPYTVIPLVGARNKEQLLQNLGSMEWSLEKEYIDRLDNVSDIPLVSPYSFIDRYTRK
jgi:aryl-alcohol dehydrogenase-like predicted oxidoreductase